MHANGYQEKLLHEEDEYWRSIDPNRRRTPSRLFNYNIVVNGPLFMSNHFSCVGKQMLQVHWRLTERVGQVVWGKDGGSP